MWGRERTKKKVLLEDLTKLWHEKIAKAEPLEDKFEKVMTTFFKRQQKEVVQNILNEKSIEEKLAISIISEGKIHLEAEGVTFDFEKWKAELIKDAEPEIAQVIGTFAQAVMDEFAVINQIDMSLPSVRNEIGRRARDMSNFVNSTTNKEIKLLLEQAEAGRLTIQEKANLISDWFDDISSSRAKTIARTETMGAANHGTIEGIRQANVNGKQWITSRDPRVRFDHQIDGQIVPVDQDFVLNNGSQVPYPMAINERCVVSPHRIEVNLEGPITPLIVN